MIEVRKRTFLRNVRRDSYLDLEVAMSTAQ